MKNIEIEIQVEVEKSAPLLKFLKDKATFQGENFQIDKYYTPQHKDFLKKRPVDEWLRLRKENEKMSITYKNWHRDKNKRSTHADEFESQIEKIDQLEKIFKVLDFKHITTVHKKRTIWNWKKYEIALDKIKGLGNYVEIEYKGKEKKVNPKKITAEMIDFLKEIGCGKIRRNYNGYPFILLFPDEVIYDEL